MRLLATLIAATVTAAIAGQEPAIELEKVGSFPARGARIYTIDFDHSGGRMLTRGRHGDLILRETTTWRELARTRTEKQSNGRILHPTQPLVVTSLKTRPSDHGDGYDVALLDLTSGTTQAVTTGRLGAGSFSSDGRRVAMLVARRQRAQTLVVGELDGTGELRVTREIEVDGPPFFGRLRFHGDAVYVSSSTDHAVLDLRRPGSRFERRLGSWLCDDPEGNGIFANSGTIHHRGEALPYERSEIAASITGGMVAFVRETDADDELWLIDSEPRLIATGDWSYAIAVSPRGVVAVSDGKGLVHVYEPGDADNHLAYSPDVRHRVLSGHEGPATHLDFSADGKYVAAGGTGALVVARADGAVVQTLAGNYGIAPGETGSELWLASDTRVQRWNAAHARVLESYEMPEGWSARHHDHRSLWADQLPKNHLRTVDGRAFAMRDTRGPRQHGTGLFHPERQQIRSLDADLPWDSNVYYGIETFQLARNNAVDQIALAQGSPPIMCGNGLEHIQWWGALRVLAGDGRVLHEEFSKTDHIAVAYSPQGRLLAVVDESGQLRVLGTAGFDTVARTTHEKLRWVAFLDEQTLIGHDGSEVLAWHLPGMDRLAVAAEGLTGAALHAAALSPDGKRAAFSVGNEVRVFDVAR